MSWNSDIIGSGNNTLINNEENRLVYDLVFLKPFKSKAKTSFIFQPEDQTTKVTWTMDANMPVFLFFLTETMKNWIGMDYERGLKMLKAIAEHGIVPATTTNRGITEIDGFSYIGIKRSLPYKEINQAIQPDFAKLMRFIQEEQNKSAKHWAAIYPKMNMRTMQMEYIAAASDEEISSDNIDPSFVRGTIKRTNALEILHEGPYDFLGNAWSMGMMHMRAKKMKKNGYPFEYYWNNPQATKPEDLRTSIFFPIKS